MVRFSLATGWRESNVTGLEWSRVDLARRVMWMEAYQSKNGESFSLPLSAEAILVLRRQQGKHPQWVFTYCGKRVKHGNTSAFKAALKRAGITNFRWHDQRHTWASWHIQNGTPLPVLQQLGGWKTARDGHAVRPSRRQSSGRVCRQPSAAAGGCWQRIGKVRNRFCRRCGKCLIIGGPWQIRTADQLVKSQLLYRLS